MKYKRLLITAGGILMALLAYFLRDVVNERIVIPLSYLWWRLGLYYHAIEEETWLVLAVMGISIIAYISIADDGLSSREADGNGKSPVQGPVEELTIWLARSQNRSYYRWLVANRLSRLARLLLRQRDGQNGSLEGSSWEATEDIKSYLKYGERRSSGGGRSRSRMDGSNLIKVLEYLESEIGEHSNANK